MKKRTLKHGAFITVEGPEGAGKSTQIAFMAEWLRREGYRVKLLREPGGTKLGEQIREVLLSDRQEKMSNYAELFLFLAARAQLVEKVILPSLDKGFVVISDRFFDSTVVYQGMAGGLGRDFVERLCFWGAQGLKPDLTFFMDIHYRDGLKRTGRRDRIERKSFAFHRNVQEGFRRVAERHSKRAAVIDAGKDISTVRKMIEKKLHEVFGS